MHQMLLHTEDSSLLGYDAVSVGKQGVLGESAASLLGLSGPRRDEDGDSMLL